MASKLKLEHWDPEKDGELTAHNMKCKLESQGYSCIQYTFPPGTDFPDHTHGYTKKDAIVAGQFRFTMFGQTVVLQPGDMMEVPKGAVHNAAVVGNEDVIFFDSTK